MDSQEQELEDKEHEIYCSCNGGWQPINKNHPDSLCIVSYEGHCVNPGQHNGMTEHTRKVIMYMFPEHDVLTEKRRRSIPDDSVVSMDRSMATKRFCPRCRKPYVIVVDFEHGDAEDGAYRRRNSQIVDPEIIAAEKQAGVTQPRNEDFDEDGEPLERRPRAWR